MNQVFVWSMVSLGALVALWVLWEILKPKDYIVGIRWMPDEDLVVAMASGREYRGACTVWHEYPSGRRVSGLDSWLCDVWQAEKWKKEDLSLTGIRSKS